MKEEEEGEKKNDFLCVYYLLFILLLTIMNDGGQTFYQCSFIKQLLPKKYGIKSFAVGSLLDASGKNNLLQAVPCPSVKIFLFCFNSLYTERIR